MLKIICDAGQFFIDIIIYKAIIIGNEKENGGYYLYKCIKILQMYLYLFYVTVKYFNQNTLERG